MGTLNPTIPYLISFSHFGFIVRIDRRTESQTNRGQSTLYSRDYTVGVSNYRCALSMPAFCTCFFVFSFLMQMSRYWILLDHYSAAQWIAASRQHIRTAGNDAVNINSSKQQERRNRGSRVSGCSPNFWGAGAAVINVRLCLVASVRSDRLPLQAPGKRKKCLLQY